MGGLCNDAVYPKHLEEKQTPPENEQQIKIMPAFQLFFQQRSMSFVLWDRVYRQVFCEIHPHKIGVNSSNRAVQMSRIYISLKEENLKV